MDTTPTPASRVSAIDPTLELTPATSVAAGASAVADSDCPQCARVALVEGSTPHLTVEVQTLLRQRLRLAALIFAAGFVVFLITHALVVNYGDGLQVFLFAFHILVAVALTCLAIVLWRHRTISLLGLRAVELGVFGLPGVFFLTLEYFSTVYHAEQGYFDFSAESWLVLMFCYALFIPNTLRRAVVILGLLALAPLVLLLTTLWFQPGIAAMLTVRDITGIPLMLVVSALACILGVDTIGYLRRQAFEARQLGQYRLKRRIGAGGMGEVYLAEHQLLKRPCALKLIRPDKAGDPRLLARFEREVRATARLSHWNTVEIFDYGSTDDGTFYYVMEYLPGMSLTELVERYGPLPPERAIYLLRQVCDALGEAHSVGLVHRDIKPGNIFAALRGGVYDVAKLLDFGLVKPLLDEEPMHLTTEGNVAGSPLFMPPERAAGDEDTDPRSDLYSLGAVAYYLVTGKPPFEGDKAIKVMIAHVHEPVVPPSKLRPEVPADLETVILRCLAKTPEERYPNAAALADALAACESSNRWTRQRAAQWWREHREAIHPCA
jgi:serine/threonine-protein kinase